MPAPRRAPAPTRSGEAPSARGSGGCHVAELFSVLGRPRMLDILHAFAESGGAPIRFGQLQTRLGISPKTLSDRLKTLVDMGFLARQAFSEIPPRVEYHPTAKTAELGELFRALEGWSTRNSLHPVPMVSTVGRVSAAASGRS
ncbi:MAG: helix-turn-helix transcriptional regulator [Thermoplasmata archaeon]|nr:helix-turn-helix transcriptional regulator [Thermoplasmata archaeon]MCI4356256.1 helix-turn-helix transcriptional regulator [Thermoplasmata archaeon]